MTGFSVPWQLEGERFIRIHDGDKKPVDEWRKTYNQYDAKGIQPHINLHNNYGVIYTTDLVVMDADNAEILGGVIRDIGNTYTVKSGRRDSTGKHLYLRICGAIPEEFAEKKIHLEDPETGNALGDLRMPHSPFYNVAPYSIHPSGQRYLPIDPEAEILRISFEELHAAIEDYIKKPKHKPFKIPDPPTPKQSPYADYRFTCLDVLMPRYPRERDGNIEGEHPIHGSTSGSNLAVSLDGSQWYCRRCGTGGGKMKALAVSCGIIDCSEADRPLTPRERAELDKELRRIEPDTYEKNRMAYLRSRMNNAAKRQNGGGDNGGD